MPTDAEFWEFYNFNTHPIMGSITTEDKAAALAYADAWATDQQVQDPAV